MLQSSLFFLSLASTYENPDYRSPIGQTSLTRVTSLTGTSVAAGTAMRRGEERGGGEEEGGGEGEGVAPAAREEGLEEAGGVAKRLVQELEKQPVN